MLITIDICIDLQLAVTNVQVLATQAEFIKLTGIIPLE